MDNRKIQYLKELPFWKTLSDHEKEYTKNNTTLTRYDAGKLLYDGGDNCLGLIYVVQGNVRVYIISEEGREITLFRLGEKEDCVISASCVISQLTFETIMKADTNSELLILNSNALQKLAKRNSYVNSYMYERITERFSQVMWVMQEIVFKRFDQRLAKFFIEEYERTGKKEIRMTQEEIAERVNSAREVVARMLRQFSRDGLVESKRGCIVLRNIDSLRSLNEK